MRVWGGSLKVFRGNTYFPKSFLMPLAFFLASGVVASVWVLSLVEERWGSPARSRCSVPCRSVSAADKREPQGQYQSHVPGQISVLHMETARL